MKKLILAITVAAFTIGAYAGEGCCAKAKAAAEAKDNTACAGKTADASKAACPVATEAAKQDASKKNVQSPRGAETNKS